VPALALVLLLAALAYPTAFAVCASLAVAGGGTATIVRARRRRARRVTIGHYHQLAPDQFEEEIAQLLRRDGCHRVRVVGGPNDRAVDVLYVSPDWSWAGAVQCKRYAPGHLVPAEEVYQVGGTYRDIHKAQRASVVTTSGFTASARAYADQAGIDLLGHDELAAWASGTGPGPWKLKGLR
jgi:restriction system protein